MSHHRNHRASADAERSAAAATDLPHVRERHLRSAMAHDVAANREELSASNKIVREAATAERKQEHEDEDARANSDGDDRSVEASRRSIARD